MRFVPLFAAILRQEIVGRRARMQRVESPSYMGRRILIVGLAVASALLLYLLLFGGSKSVWLLEALIALFPIGLIALAAPAGRSTRGSRHFRWVLGLLAVLVTTSGLLMQATSTDPRRYQVAGLPIATWFLLLGIAIIPLVLFGLAHALTFQEGGMTEGSDLEPRSPDGGNAP